MRGPTSTKCLKWTVATAYMGGTHEDVRQRIT